MQLDETALKASEVPLRKLSLNPSNAKKTNCVGVGFSISGALIRDKPRCMTFKFCCCKFFPSNYYCFSVIAPCLTCW